MAETITQPPFNGINNFRDVGRLPRLREGMVLRSGRLDDATAEDADLMVNSYRLKTVIDLRTKSEVLNRKNISRNQEKGPSCGEKRWNTVKVNLIGRKFEMNLVQQLRWWQALWFFVLMLLQRRMTAIRIIGRNVMSPKGLVGLNKDSLQFCQYGILQERDLFLLYLDPQAYPVLVHCTQGKDRSGLIIMLILFVLRIPLKFVKADYVLSNQGLDRVRASMITEVLEIGMDEKYTQAPEEIVDEVWKFLEDGGGVDMYLDELGFGQSKRQKLRSLLLE
ncbi:protein-tyrosine phosphatase-like protein [Lentinula aff. detonsa]|uniref:Protein-tyrosine phosphatase-like protein n=1 Tax=Lentinula aff. detonsa TaxID=2804958 RepID=A0AA38KMW8_9AGAR|nr:protein-tyrosine phosphatase-like protein [Lentinula aff. detonsa]